MSTVLHWLARAACIACAWVPLTTQAFTIYDEGFALTWSDDSVNASIITHTPDNPEPYCGLNAALVDHSPGGEFRPVGDGRKSMDGKNVLSFAVYQDSTNALSGDVTVELYDTSMRSMGAVSILPYIPDNPMQAHKWYLVHIPLAHLNTPAYILGVGFTSEDGLVYAWDCMRTEYLEGYDNVPPPPPPGTTSTTIFADAIATGWENWSWGAAVFTTDSWVYQGTHGLSVGFTAAWGGLYLHHAPMSTGGLETLRFAVNAANSGGQEPIIALTDAGGTVIHELQLTDYVPGNTLADDTWYSVIIPLADLQAANSTIAGFMVQSPTAPTGLYLDEIVLSTVAGSTYSGGATPPPPSSDTDMPIFIDALATGWYDWSWNTNVYTSTTVSYEGTPVLVAGFIAPYAGMHLYHDPFNTSAYETLRFAVYGPHGEEVPYVALTGPAPGYAPIVSVPLTGYVANNVLVAETWYEVVIPLSDLGAANTEVTGVMLQTQDVPRGLYLDEIVLSTVAGSTYSGGTTPPPPSSGASATLYDEAIGTGWSSWSWGITYDGNSPLHYKGEEGLAVTYTNAWGGLYLHADTFNTTGYNALTFAIHGGTTGGQEHKLLVTLYNEQGDPLNEVDLEIAPYLVGGVLTPYVWYEVRIPA